MNRISDKKPSHICAHCMWGGNCDHHAADSCEYFDPLWADVPVDDLGTARDRAIFYDDWNEYMAYADDGEVALEEFRRDQQFRRR